MLSSEKHFGRLLAWLELESEAESERVAAQHLIRSSKSAESTGETLLDLVVADSEPGIGDRFLVTFVKRNRELSLPWNRLKVGTPVLLAPQSGNENNNWTGVVSKRNRESIQLSLNQIPDGDRFRIDLAPDQLTRQRCAAAIEKATSARGRAGYLRDVLSGEKEPKFGAAVEFDCSQTTLNDSQVQAVRFCLAAQDLAIIHGPPGTGKTTTIVELIVAALKRGDKVLACAPSNTAVDNLVLKLVQRGESPVRIGHPARIASALQGRTLDALAADDANMRIAKEMFSEADQLYRKLDRYSRVRPDRSVRQQMRSEAKQLQRDARLMQRQAVQHVLDKANLICATNTMDDTILGDRHFDLLIIDEACQTTEPPCWIPIGRSEKVVFAGDHCQLPPVVISQQAASDGFGVSLMERLMSIESACDFSRMLTTQYRMNDAIMQFSSRHFYRGSLTSDESVANHSLLSRYQHDDLAAVADVIQFIDTAGASWTEEQEPGGESKRNPEEAEFAIKQIQRLAECGIPLKDMAVIVPYAAQVRLIREKAAECFGDQHHLEIDTVDGFQGREKEVVLISLVRSNDRCEIGFLADERRMNVAMTRARRKLTIIGDSATIGGNEFFQSLILYFEQQSAYRSIWEYL